MTINSLCRQTVGGCGVTTSQEGSIEEFEDDDDDNEFAEHSVLTRF